MCDVVGYLLAFHLTMSQWFLGRRQKTEAVALPGAYQRILDHDLKEAEII